MDYATDNRDVILRYIPLVKRIAGRIEAADPSIDTDDLVSAGVIGLMDALGKYDASKAVPFEAYASTRIKGSIIDEIRKSGKVSRSRIDKLNRFYRVREELEQEMMRAPSEYEVCKKLGISDRDLKGIHETMHFLSAVSIDGALCWDDQSDLNFGETIQDEMAVLPEEEVVKSELRVMLASALQNLNERERVILSLYYVEELTLREIGYAMGISVPRVSQLHGKILMKLRDSLSRVEKEL